MSDTHEAHILVVDDDDRLRALISRYLREQGFAVSTAPDTRAARTLIALYAFDLIVLDVMLPEENGISLARSLSGGSGPTLPVLMLSARGEAQDRVAGLEAGVDDYLTKPFEPRELALRIRAILRRFTPASQTGRQCRFGEYIFALDSGVLMRGDVPLHLTTAETAILRALAERAGEPVEREALAQLAAQDGSAERSVDVQITRLRKKIEPEDAPPRYIQTVRGAGYVLQGMIT